MSYEEGPDGGAGVMDVIGRRFSFRLKLTGSHQPVNAAGVVACALAAGVEPAMALDVLAGLEPAEGRGSVFTTRVEDRALIVIDDSYNANPASMRAAFSSLKARAPKPGGRRVAVIGEMLELGPQGPQMHADLAEPLKDAGAELVLAVGEGARPLAEALNGALDVAACTDADAAAALLIERTRDGDVVLIKGSNASGVHRIAATLKKGRQADRP
jgi:UDP-N-acetylmuramoyl-tripeptide--D-alanyl-D-alanine ligase